MSFNIAYFKKTIPINDNWIKKQEWKVFWEYLE